MFHNYWKLIVLILIIKKSEIIVAHDYSDENFENDLSEEILELLNTNEFDLVRKDHESKMLKYMNESVDPCDDFFEYACGNWQQYNPIPNDNFEYNNFQKLVMVLNENLQKLLSEDVLAENAEDKAKIFYASCMNEEQLNIRGIEPIRKFLNEFGGWPVLNRNWTDENFDLTNLTAQTALLKQNILLHLTLRVNYVNSTQYRMYVDEFAYGLPSRHFYLKKSYSKLLNAYKSFIVNVTKKFGAIEEDAEQMAEEIIQLEIVLANITRLGTNKPLNDSDYNNVTIDIMHEKYPEIDWKKYLEIILETPINSSSLIVLAFDNYIEPYIELIRTTDSRILANYILWRCVMNFMDLVDNSFDNEMRGFFRSLTGVQVKIPRWQKCTVNTNDLLGYAVSSLYVRKYFNKDSKYDVTRLTDEVKLQFLDTLKNVNWLDEEAKQKASTKINSMIIELGYPNFITIQNELNERYQGLEFDSGTYFENSLNIFRHEAKYEYQKYFQSVDKLAWPAIPTVVNAYFEQNNVRILLPAGIMQPPLYHQSFPNYLKYGSLGAFIGHEITHGFDDTGKNFDSFGNMKNWWSNDSVRSFTDKADCFIEQYSNYTLNGFNILGDESVSEDIADNGGVRQAFYSYKKWITKNPDLAKSEQIPSLNMTSEQLFFLGFAQSWCGAIRPEAMEMRLRTNPHTPGKFRVIGALSNFEEFSNTYNCPLESNMNPMKKCRIW